MKRKDLRMKRNVPLVLSGLAVIGLVGTTISAIQSTPKVYDLLKKAEEEKHEKLTKFEVMKIAVPEYAPTLLLGTATMACIIGANMTSRRHQTSLASAYGLLDQSYKKYKNKVIEHCGIETHDQIMDEIIAEEAEPRYIHAYSMFSDCRQFLDEDYSSPLLFCIDAGERKFFSAPLEQVLLAEYHLNRNYTMRGVSLLNEFYDFLGLEKTSEGEELGWSVTDEYTWVDFNHRKIETRDGTEYYAIEMPVSPSTDWQDEYYHCW